MLFANGDCVRYDQKNYGEPGIVIDVHPYIGGIEYKIAWFDIPDREWFRENELYRVCGNCYQEKEFHDAKGKCLFAATVWK